MTVVELLDHHAFVSLLFVIFLTTQAWMIGGTVADWIRAKRKKP